MCKNCNNFLYFFILCGEIKITTSTTTLAINLSIFSHNNVHASLALFLYQFMQINPFLSNLITKDSYFHCKMEYDVTIIKPPLHQGGTKKWNGVANNTLSGTTENSSKMADEFVLRIENFHTPTSFQNNISTYDMNFIKQKKFNKIIFFFNQLINQWQKLQPQI